MRGATLTKVAFLGLGRMGAPMAMHVARAGHALTVWNRTPGKADALVAAGAMEAETPGDAARDADFIVTMLFGPDAVREVLLGRDGAIHAAPRGSLVIESSTIGRDTALQLARSLADHRIAFVDAPVAGSVEPATQGTLGVLVGGADDDVARARPLLELWGDPAKVLHVGPVGSGAAAKLALNLTLGVATAAIGEAMRLGRELGLADGPLLDVLSSMGPLAGSVSSKRGMFESGSFQPTRFSLGLMSKDLELCAHTGNLGALGLHALAAARDAVVAGHADDDYAVLATRVADARR
ncbi:MAG: NAD(P)-dependent oxidoreductase [Frankia sp.]|nr:NAD(P)-dependent oxidoreductase [Frankia sp.]